MTSLVRPLNARLTLLALAGTQRRAVAPAWLGRALENDAR